MTARQRWQPVRTGDGSRIDDHGRRWRLAALAVTLALAAGCGSSPSAPPATPGAATAAPPVVTPGQPTAQATPVGGPPPTGTPPPTATPPPTPTPRPVPAHWVSAGSLPSIQLEPWTGHIEALARLGNGRVLAIADDALGAEVWNPKTGHWRATDGLGKTRHEFAMVALWDGRALVIGGTNSDSQSYSSAYAYDAAAGHWSKVGLMAKARSLPAAAVLADGRVLVAGGYYAHAPNWGAVPNRAIALAAFHPGEPPASGGGTPDDIDPPDVGTAMATAELFDPSSGTWQETGHLRYARYGAQATTLADGRVLIVGSSPGRGSIGVSVDRRAFSTAELYDPKTGKFTLTGSLPPIDTRALARQGAPAWVVAEVAKDPSPEPNGIGTLVALDDGGAVLIGSTYWWKHQAEFTRSFRYDAASGRWSEIGQTWLTMERPQPPYTVWASSAPNLVGSAVARLPDGRILVVGGGGVMPEGEVHTERRVLVYNPRTDNWGSTAAMPAARTQAPSVVLADGSVLVVGGDKSGRSAVRSAVRFVPRQ